MNGVRKDMEDLSIMAGIQILSLEKETITMVRSGDTMMR
jgi:hypothetical protein